MGREYMSKDKKLPEIIVFAGPNGVVEKQQLRTWQRLSVFTLMQTILKNQVCVLTWKRLLKLKN